MLLPICVVAQYPYKKLALHLGSRPISSYGSELLVGYTDPNGVRVQRSNSLQAWNFFSNISATYEWGRMKRLHHEVSFAFTPARLMLFTLGFGMGYNQPIGNKLLLRPKVAIEYNVGWFTLGKTDMPASLQVNNTSYPQAQIDMRLSEQFSAWRPAVELVYVVNRNFDVRAQAGYLFLLHREASWLTMRAKTDLNNDDSERSESVSLAANNVQFLADGQPANRPPYNIGGWFFSIGVAYCVKGYNYK